jgi:hypothetical protein
MEHDAAAGEPVPEAPPRWFEELRGAFAALRELFAAQWELLGAEVRLARAAALTLLLAALVATVFAVALGLTVLALLGWALAHWFGSWAWALFTLAVLQALGLAAAIALFRRCLRWLSLPASRAQWHALVRESTARRPAQPGEPRADDDLASMD